MIFYVDNKWVKLKLMEEIHRANDLFQSINIIDKTLLIPAELLALQELLFD